jgi:hypothetical protein
MKILSRLLLVVLLGSFIATSGGYSQAAETLNANRHNTKIGIGIAVTPKNFPAHTAADVDEAFRMAKALGDYSVFIFQWHDLDMQTVKLMMEKARAVGLTPILGLSPTSLDKGRKELDLPESIRKKAGRNVSFGNPIIREAFKKSARDLARLKPAYLCLATEINFLALQRLDEYLHFASLYKEAYQEVKRISPRTKVFVSFQWEWVRILDAKEPDKIKEHSKVFDIFRPELDVVGFTTYPSPFHKSPADLPIDYYSWMYNHIRKTDEVLFMETGWPTSGTGSEDEQAAYIRRLPELLKGSTVKVIAWALLHDVGLAEFDADLNTAGLVTRDGKRKKGYDAFTSLKKSLQSSPQ